MQEDTNGVNTCGFNEGVRSSIIAGEVDNNNTLGERDIGIDIKEVITVNNSEEDLQKNNENNNNITEQASLPSELPITSIEISKNVSVSIEKEQIKEPQMTELKITTESSQQE